MGYSSQSISIVTYFFLNLFITITNKHILSASHGATQRPYLLTAVHGSSTFIGCIWINKSKHAQSMRDGGTRHLTWDQHIYLAVFSLFYTVNIALSNLSLALVDLSLNQTIRASAPVLTVLTSIIVLRKSIQSYSISTHLSLVPITVGAILAVTSASATFDNRPHQLQNLNSQLRIVGIAITFLGALTAVLKTIFTHKLMTSLSLNLTPSELLRILSPYAIIQACAFAYANGEFSSASFFISSKAFYSTLILWTSNAIAAFLLNLASFEANRTCGPVSMAVAANLKQVVILVLSLAISGVGSVAEGTEQGNSIQLIMGTVLTVVGGIWYAWTMSRSEKATSARQPAKGLIQMSEK